MGCKFPKLWKTSRSGWLYSGVDDVQSRETVLSITELGKTVSVTRKDVAYDVNADNNWSSANDGAIAARVGEGIFVVVLGCYSEVVKLPDVIYAVDPDTGRVLWRRSVYNDFPVAGSSGVSWGTYAEASLDGDRIFLWSGHDVGLSVQVFDKHDGSVIAIFSTAHETYRQQ